VSGANKNKLLEMMRNIPELLELLFKPRRDAVFCLWEVMIVGRKGGEQVKAAGEGRQADQSS
jgi:hypothetical protein